MDVLPAHSKEHVHTFVSTLVQLGQQGVKPGSMTPLQAQLRSLFADLQDPAKTAIVHATLALPLYAQEDHPDITVANVEVSDAPSMPHECNMSARVSESGSSVSWSVYPRAHQLAACWDAWLYRLFHSSSNAVEIVYKMYIFSAQYNLLLATQGPTFDPHSGHVTAHRDRGSSPPWRQLQQRLQEAILEARGYTAVTVRDLCIHAVARDLARREGRAESAALPVLLYSQGGSGDHAPHPSIPPSVTASHPPALFQEIQRSPEGSSITVQSYMETMGQSVRTVPPVLRDCTLAQLVASYCTSLLDSQYQDPRGRSASDRTPCRRLPRRSQGCHAQSALPGSLCGMTVAFLPYPCLSLTSSCGQA